MRTDRDFDDLVARIKLLEERLEQPAAHIAAPGGAVGGGVFPLIIRSNDGVSKMMVQRVRYKSFPILQGSVEPIGVPFRAYPIPYYKYSNYDIPGLIITEDPPRDPPPPLPDPPPDPLPPPVLGPFSIWFKPWTVLGYLEGGLTFVFLPLKASPSGRIVTQPVNTTSEFSGA